MVSMAMLRVLMGDVPGCIACWNSAGDYDDDSEGDASGSAELRDHTRDTQDSTGLQCHFNSLNELLSVAFYPRSEVAYCSEVVPASPIEVGA